MAELVHLRLEHTLPELEEMERIGLFSRDEIHKIIKKRKKFEYKLRRSSKRKVDFINYIDYEKNLLSLIAKRRERLLCESKKQEIDHKLAKRINRLYKGAISRFPDDSDLIMSQINFCKKMKWYDNINALHTHMLKVHSKKPELWLIAAKWEMEEMRSHENARKLFQRGVLINPKSKELWLEYFGMELMYIDLIQKRSEILQIQKVEDPDATENDVILSGKIPQVVFEKALEEIDDVDFALHFIQKALPFDFAGKHIEYILEKVSERYPDKEETLDAFAKQPILNSKEELKLGKERGIKRKEILRKINEEIFASYESAVERLPTEKMWSLYLEFALDLMKPSKLSKKENLQDRLIKIMERAAACNCLSVTYYMEWIHLLFERGEENVALSMSLEVARKWKRVDLWFKALTFHIQCMQPSKQIYTYLLEAINTVPEKDSVVVWKLGVDWLSIFDPDCLLAFFENGIKKCKEICVPLKEMYLETAALKGSLEYTRMLYKRFKKLGPMSHQIIRKMVAIEKGQLKPSIELLRRYFEDGILEFGSTNLDIWLDYMKLEIEHENGNSAATGTLIWRAKKTLQPEYKDDFETRLTEFMTESHTSQDL